MGSSAAPGSDGGAAQRTQRADHQERTNARAPEQPSLEERTRVRLLPWPIQNNARLTCALCQCEESFVLPRRAVCPRFVRRGSAKLMRVANPGTAAHIVCCSCRTTLVAVTMFLLPRPLPSTLLLCESSRSELFVLRNIQEMVAAAALWSSVPDPSAHGHTTWVLLSSRLEE